MSFISILQGLGLSENEAKVYLANLELGIANVQEISRKSKVKRTTIYTVVEGLKQQGLVSEIKRDGKIFFSAEGPENLVRVSGERLNRLKEILPDLKSIHNVSDTKPKVRFYEGREGYVSVYERVLKDKPEELLGIGSYDDFYRHLDPQYEADWIKRRVENKIELRWLVFKTVRTMSMRGESKKLLRQIRFLPEKFSFLSHLLFYPSKVIIISGKEKEFVAVVIESAEFYQMFKNIFEIIWEAG